MKILRTIGILVIVSVLVIGVTGGAYAKGPPEGLPHGSGHSPGKSGLFGTVESASGDVINVKTKEGSTVEVTLTETAKYKAPGQTKGWIGVNEFVNDVLGGDIESIVGRRIAALVSFTNGDTADALRLMLFKTTPPLHAHRVGIVTEFTEGEGGSITINDNKGVSHTFEVSEDTVYRPAEITPDSITPYEIGDNETLCCVTVVTTGDPKNPDNKVAKAIVLHEDLPDWAGGRIIIKKILDSDDSDDLDQSFDFETSWSDPFSLLHNGQYKSGWLEPNTYTVTELFDGLPAGWELTDIDIQDPDEESPDPSADTATIDLDLGETVTVTFTNTYTPE